MPTLYSSDPDQRDNYHESFIERYLAGPSHHVGQGGAPDDHQPMEEDGEEEEAAAAALPALNIDDPEDFDGSPISNKEYETIPIDGPSKDLITVKIKRTAFVRQKVSRARKCFLLLIVLHFRRSTSRITCFALFSFQNPI
jgi:hypothetical protein